MGNPQLCGALLSTPCNDLTETAGGPGQKPGNQFKLIFALGLLMCSLILAVVAIAKARKSLRKNRGADSWKMTAFQKLGFSVSDVLECVKDGNVIGRGGAGVVYHGKMCFGVVLLELVTGRRPVGGEFGEGVDIVQWTRCSTNYRREDVTRVIDQRLAAVPEDEAMHLFFVAMLCVEENSVERPTMREVVQMLSEFPRRRSPELESESSSRQLNVKASRWFNEHRAISFVA